MNVTAKHTPTPWRATGQQIVARENGYCVAVVSSPHPRARGKERMEDLEFCQGNTVFIVRACNAHDKLVNALDEISSVAACSVELSDWPELQQALEHARAALAAAGEPV